MAHKFIPANQVPDNVGAYFYYLATGMYEMVVVPLDNVIQAKRHYVKSNAAVKGWCIITEHEREYGVTIWL